MSASRVMKHFDVIDQLHLGIPVTFELLPSSLFTVEKRLTITALS
jgi:hypothetical protein